MSPHNVFVGWDGGVKLLDFGVAAFERVDRTVDGVIKGKLAYMAPEQARGEPVDRRADVFSVGVILWELLANRRMWTNIQDPALYKELVAGRIPPLDPASPQAPPALRRICAAALAPSPAARTADADVVRRQLEGWLGSAGGGRPPARQLGERIGAWFAVERERLDGIVADAMSGEEELEPTRLYSPNQATRSRPVAPTPGTESTVIPGPPAPLPRTRRSTMPIALALLTVFGATFVTAAAAGIAMLRWSERRAPGVCPAIRSTVDLEGEIDADFTLTCTHTYRLQGVVRVLPGATLTLEPGWWSRAHPWTRRTTTAAWTTRL